MVDATQFEAKLLIPAKPDPLFSVRTHRSVSMAGSRDPRLWSTTFAVVVLMAMAVSARAASFALKWSPQSHSDGLLGAFEAVQDDRGGSNPGVKHITVQSNDYRFDMPLNQSEGHSGKRDRQRNEVVGMVTKPARKVINILQGETWRIQHKLFIPKSLKATTSFTHIMQLLSTLPIMTISLRNKDNTPTMELNLFNNNAGGSKVIGATALSPLQEKWIESEITFTAATKGAIQWIVRDVASKAVVLQVDGQGVLYEEKRVRPKWGIYRSLGDSAHLETCYMLITDLRAWKLE